MSRNLLAYLTVVVLLISVGIFQSWSVALSIFNLCLISAVMALGVNIQWGYAGLFNVGIMGFAALGGVATVLVAKEPVTEAWQAGGFTMLLAGLVLVASILAYMQVYKRMKKSPQRKLTLIVVGLGGLILMRYFYDQASTSIENVNPVVTGYLGGAGLPILFSWVVGGIFAGAAAWLIGKITLGLRTDYLAIATLGISEIIITLIKNEEWLTRGVKNVSGLPRPVPYEIGLQNSTSFVEWVQWFHTHFFWLDTLTSPQQLQAAVIEASGIIVKLSYSGLFLSVLVGVLVLSSWTLNSPWGRMMRAIRDNENAAEAMGKNVVKRHLQVFVIGSFVIGIAGAMLATLDGQLTPVSYHPLRFTFLIWVMVIVGGSGNNYGAVLGAFVVWFAWIQAEPVGVWFIETITAWVDDTNPLKLHFLDTAQHMRLFIMGMVLVLIMRYNQKGILPEVVRKT